MDKLFLYSILSCALWWLGSRALITKLLWSHYPSSLAAFMDCPACVGFWWGLILSATVGQTYGFDVVGLPAYALVTPLLVGLCMIVIVPFLGGLLQWGLETVGTVIDDNEDE